MYYNLVVDSNEEGKTMSERGKVQFKYVFQDDYNPEYCNGVYGGVNPHGEIVINFYFERFPIPHSVTNNVNLDGSLGEVASTSPENSDSMFIRYVTNGVVLDRSTAQALYDWLGNQLNVRNNAEEAHEEVHDEQTV